MSEVYLDCDSPCISCGHDRVKRISSYQQRNLQGVYYCVNCGLLTLCKRGVGFRMVKGKLRPFCPRCERELAKIHLRYDEGKDHRPFEDDILLIVRIPLKSRFDITKVLRGDFFEDLADVLLYIYFNEGEGEYNIVRYDKKRNQYSVIFSGYITSEKVILEIVRTEVITPPTYLEKPEDRAKPTSQ
ncbi:MAG: hypothetical protein U9O98_11405 [Asgard group archaeon]|nr:hypothetical protein [Asgard group archaeon]